MTIEKLYEIYRDCGYCVSTDSRSIRGGELFFALKGENFDGDAFAAGALEHGAAKAVVSEKAELCNAHEESLIRVPDTFETLRQLAIYHRQRLGIPVIGLTGTNGKTTTKELIASVLGAKFNVCATQGNFNNDIGVPLSLLRMIPDNQIAVIEMGASHPDDIAKLVEVSQPDYGLITNVGKAHLQGFGSFEGVKAAKGELYKWLGRREGGVIFLDQDDPDLVEMAHREPCHVWGYGINYQHVTLLPATAESPFVALRLSDGSEVHTNLVGAYNASNVLAALAVGEYFGVSRKDAISAIEGYIPSNSRSQLQRVGDNTLIVDAYNANPSSMGVALDNLIAMQGPSKLALLGDMRELGPDSTAEHIAVVKRLAGSDIRFYLVGDEFLKAIISCIEDGILSGIPFSRDVRFGDMLLPEIGTDIPLNAAIPADSAFRGWFGTSENLALELSARRIRNTIVLIKGSRGIRMEKVLPSLTF